jgi:hypothetical protein
MPLYTGPDYILPLNWKISQGDNDVHAIAIVSASPRLPLDHGWNPDDHMNPENYFMTMTLMRMTRPMMT